MALTPFRWVVAFVAGSLLLVSVATIGTRKERVNDPTWELMSNRVSTYGSHATSLALRLHSTLLIDSVRASAARLPVTNYRVLVDPAIPAALKAVLPRLAANGKLNMGEATRTGVDVAFIWDTLSYLRGVGLRNWWRASAAYALPKKAGDRCLVLVSLSRNDLVRGQPRYQLQSEASARSLLGPCAFYGAFGQPGPQIDRWLRTRGWAFTGDGSWRVAGDTTGLNDPYYYGSSMRGDHGLMRRVPTRGLQCLTGQLGACEAAMVAPTNGSMRVRDDLLMQQTRYLGWRANVGVAFGDRESSLLADMVRTVGRDQFEKFWASPDSVPAAFQAATGKPIGSWVHDWEVTQFGTLPTGPDFRIWAVGTALVLIAAGIYASLRLSEHRQYS